MQDTSAKDNWDRYLYVLGRGHDEYVYRAARLEGFYLGGDVDGQGRLLGGGQWTEADLQVLEDQGRPAYEFNEIRPSINSAIGYQIHNRMDIAFRPAGGEADQDVAEVRTKLAMHILRTNNYHYAETQVFSDGLIEQRGYLDTTVKFEDNILGDACIEVLDPRDVLPDPDAKGYDPDSWGDVLITRWLSLDEIEERHGRKNRDAVEGSARDEGDFGDADASGERNKFGAIEASLNGCMQVGGIKRYRVVERQQFRYAQTQVAIHPSGDVEVVEDAKPDMMADLQAKGCMFTRKMTKRVWWTIATKEVMLFEGWSPYPWLTVLPYFPYFRRGKTRGMVDIAIGPQQVLNKAMSQNIHIVNTTANSGWIVEEDSLTNMDTDDLEETGASTGLVMEVAKGAKAPEKIQPNAVPQGIDRLIDRALNTVKDVTVPEAMRGENSQEISGVAIQSRQFASQQQLAVVLDNLALTRNLLARRIDWMISHYYDAERVFVVTDTHPDSGQEVSTPITINQWDGQGGWLNDMTVGKYDIAISEQPMQVTFENSQFTQALELRKAGVAVPDWAVIKHSNLADKQEILADMKGPATDPMAEAEADLLKAQAEKTRAETVNKGVEAMFASVQAGQTIAAIPSIAGIADTILKSAGFRDRDGGETMPQGVSPDMQAQEIGTAMEGRPPFLQGDQVAALNNTDPRFPANPQSPMRGVREGIETPEADSVA